MTATYRLTWERGGVFILPKARALELIGGWRRHGVVTGDLEAGRVTFWSDLGQRARLEATPAPNASGAAP